jgi:hypothetical protein
VHCGFSDKNMTNIRETKNNNVQLASGNNLEVKKIGTIYIEDKYSKELICLIDYHHAPGVAKEMISLRKLIEDGWKPEFSTTEKINLNKGESKIICKRDSTDGMFLYTRTSCVLCVKTTC